MYEQAAGGGGEQGRGGQGFCKGGDGSMEVHGLATKCASQQMVS